MHRLLTIGCLRRTSFYDLFLAISYGLVCIVVLWCLSGCGSDYRDIHDAAATGDLEAVKGFLSKGVDVNATRDDSFFTALHWAAAGDRAEVVEFLIQNGATVDAGLEHGKPTPLHRAAWSGCLEAMDILLDNGADIEASPRGNTPLHRVIRCGDQHMVHGVVLGPTLPTIRLLVERGADVNARNNGGYTPLDMAASRCALETVEFLINQGASVDTVADSGFTPLHSVAFQDDVDEAVRVAQFLLENGADVYAVDKEGKKPIDYAMEQNPSSELVKLLESWDSRM